MRVPVAALAALTIAAAGCSRQNDGSSELVRELRAMRGTLERMQGSQGSSRPGGRVAELDVNTLHQALEPLRELVQTLIGEQETLRARQEALASEMSRWAQIVAPVLQGGAAADPRGLQALQDRLAKLEEEMRAQDTRHREVQDLLLRAMNSTSERLGAFLETLSEIRRSDTAPGTEPGQQSPSEPDRGSTESPDPGRTEEGPREGGTEREPANGSPAAGRLPGDGPVGLASRARAEPWTPWILLAGGALALLFIWRLWREPDSPPPVQPAVEPEPQDWWVVVEELAQAMGVQPGEERLTATEPPADDSPYYAELADPAGRERDRAGTGKHALSEMANEPELADPRAESAAGTGATGGGATTPESEAPVRDAQAPALLELDEPSADAEDAAERLRRWITEEPRVLLRPAPRIESGDGHVRLQAWVTWDLPIGERRHLWTAARQVVHAGGRMPGPR